MRSYVVLSIALALAGFTVYALAQEAPAQAQVTRKQLVSKAAVKEFNDVFLGALITSRVYDAFQIMKAAAPDAEGEIEATRQTTETLLDGVRGTYGKPVEFELLDTKSLGDTFVRYDYLFKLEKTALHFRATYYKAKRNGTWVPVQLTFEENLTQLFEDLGKSENEPGNK